jgi:MFS family permease
VVNAYLLTFGGFLLLGGRLGDLYGHRRIFLLGLAVFTVASAACGLANTRLLLIAARAIQGLGGAVVSAVALSLIMNVFTEPGERARAMGIYGFVCSGGGSIGVLLGGLLTSSLSWHWIFLVNLPIGVAVYAMCRALLPAGRGMADAPKLDLAGAITVTASLMFAVYAVINGNEVGWTSTATRASPMGQPEGWITRRRGGSYSSTVVLSSMRAGQMPKECWRRLPTCSRRLPSRSRRSRAVVGSGRPR